MTPARIAQRLRLMAERYPGPDYSLSHPDLHNTVFEYLGHADDWSSDDDTQWTTFLLFVAEATSGVPEGVPTWQQRAAERAAFERGVSAMRDVAVTVIRARHESGYPCDPWKLVEAIRAAKEPTDPAGVAPTEGGQQS